jgi:hypothetical protein
MAIDPRHDMRAAAAMAAATAEDRADAQDAISSWNDRLSVVGRAWFSPTCGAALLTAHYWLHVICGGCNVATAIDLRISPCNPDTPISEILPTMHCERCSGHIAPAKPIGLFPTPSPPDASGCLVGRSAFGSREIF